MRRAGALAAAALLALALAAAGCDLVDSLTPFGLGTQDYGDPVGGAGTTENLNGLWAGTTGTGGAATFQVADNTVSNLIFKHIAEGCTLTFDAGSAEERIANNQFTVAMLLSTGGTFQATGSFSSSSRGGGSYSFAGLPTGTCPTSGSGTFSVTKTTF